MKHLPPPPEREGVGKYHLIERLNALFCSFKVTQEPLTMQSMLFLVCTQSPGTQMTKGMAAMLVYTTKECTSHANQEYRESSINLSSHSTYMPVPIALGTFSALFRVWSTILLFQHS